MEQLKLPGTQPMSSCATAFTSRLNTVLFVWLPHRKVSTLVSVCEESPNAAGIAGSVVLVKCPAEERGILVDNVVH